MCHQNKLITINRYISFRVSLLYALRLIPGTLADVQKYSTLGNLIIENLNCVGDAKSSLVGCLDNAFVCCHMDIYPLRRQKKGE